MTAKLDYRALYSLLRDVNATRDSEADTLRKLLTHIGAAVSVSHGCLVMLRDAQTVDAVYHLNENCMADLTLPGWSHLLRYGLLGHVYYSRRTVALRNISHDPRWIGLPGVKEVPEMGSAVGLPLMHADAVAGVLILHHAQLDYFSGARLALLEEARLLAGDLLENLRAPSTQNYYHTVFTDAVVPILLTDLQGRIGDINLKAADYLGYFRGDLIGTLMQDLNIDVIGELDLASLDAGQELNLRTLVYDINGKALPSLVRVRRVPHQMMTAAIDASGASITAELEWVLQDMSAQTELEQIRHDMMAMVYHDLRSPLQNIVASIYKLGDVLKNHDNPAVLRLLQLGLRSTRQMQRLVNSLLDIQRLEENRGIIKREPTELRVLLIDAVQLTQGMAEDAEQKIELALEDDLPTIAVDSDMILRVVINLIENAIKYTPDGGTITVRAKQDNQVVRVTVEDSGPGIPRDLQKRIFEKYSRIRSPQMRKGLGLGLAFCRLAVNAHAGRIWVESDGEQGSAFIFTLPLQAADDDDDRLALSSGGAARVSA